MGIFCGILKGAILGGSRGLHKDTYVHNYGANWKDFVHKTTVREGLSNKKMITEKAAHVPELCACKGLINLDQSYGGSTLVKGKIKNLIPNNSSTRAAIKTIFLVLVSPYPTTTMCKI